MDPKGREQSAGTNSNDRANNASRHASGKRPPGRGLEASAEWPVYVSCKLRMSLSLYENGADSAKNQLM
mgnify:FL=1